MRRAARIDANQTAIVAALRACGATVHIIKLPFDLVVGIRGVTTLIEIKDGAKAPSAQAHTQLQQDAIAAWRGSPIITINSVPAAVDWINGVGRC
jgi:hypothetical protein